MHYVNFCLICKNHIKSLEGYSSDLVFPTLVSVSGLKRCPVVELDSSIGPEKDEIIPRKNIGLFLI